MKHVRNLAMLLLAMTVGSVSAQSRDAGSDGALAMSQSRIAAPAQAAAERGVREFTARFSTAAGRLPPGFPLDVATPGELDNLRLGWGFQVYDVSAAALATALPMENLAQPTGIWRYEILSAGKPVGLASVAKTSKGWQLVSIGGTGLARDIHALAAAHAGQGAVQMRYVRVPQATADFIQIKRGTAQAQFAPLQAARDLLKGQGVGVAKNGLLNASVLRTQLRQAVAANASR